MLQFQSVWRRGSPCSGLSVRYGCLPPPQRQFQRNCWRREHAVRMSELLLPLLRLRVRQRRKLRQLLPRYRRRHQHGLMRPQRTAADQLRLRNRECNRRHCCRNHLSPLRPLPARMSTRRRFGGVHSHPCLPPTIFIQNPCMFSRFSGELVIAFLNLQCYSNAISMNIPLRR